MISLQDELLTPKQAASLLPSIEGKKIDQSAIWRWARQGLQGVKLEHIRLGGRILTTMEALERFTKELAEVDLPSAVNNEEEDS